MEPEHSLYHGHKSSPLVPILRQMYLVHTFPPSFHRVQSDIIFTSVPSYSKWSLSFRFPDQHLLCTSYLSHVCWVPCPFHPP